MIELTICLQYLIVLAISRVPLLLRITSKPRVPLHFQCHFGACAASSSLNSRVFAVSARANPTSTSFITFQEIKTGTQPYDMLTRARPKTLPKKVLKNSFGVPF